MLLRPCAGELPGGTSLSVMDRVFPPLSDRVVLPAYAGQPRPRHHGIGSRYVAEETVCLSQQSLPGIAQSMRHASAREVLRPLVGTDQDSPAARIFALLRLRRRRRRPRT